MLSFSSICKELETDLEQQGEMLDIFSKNNFFWLDTIRHKVELTSITPKQDDKKLKYDPSQRKSSKSNNTTNKFATITQVNNQQIKDINEQKLQDFQISKSIKSENSNLEQITHVPLTKINENHNENIPKQRSILRDSLRSYKNDMESDSSVDNTFAIDSNRHISFGVTKDDNEQLNVLENSPIICNQETISDVLSSESESQATPIKLERVTENVVSNVTPQRSSLTRQAIHASYDRFQINAQLKQAFCIHSDTYYTSSEAISSCSTTESEPLPLDSKEENKTRKFADARDIRMSIDPTEILLSTEDFTSTNSGTFSVASNALELSLQAKLNREKWARMVAEKNRSLVEQKD